MALGGPLGQPAIFRCPAKSPCSASLRQNLDPAAYLPREYWKNVSSADAEREEIEQAHTSELRFGKSQLSYLLG